LDRKWPSEVPHESHAPLAITRSLASVSFYCAPEASKARPKLDTKLSTSTTRFLISIASGMEYVRGTSDI
jgi:hypothetical protein